MTNATPGPVTNGTIDPAHYGPIGDAARHIASYCEGRARVHVYTAAFDTLTAWNTRIEAAPPVQSELVEALRQVTDDLEAEIEGRRDGELPRRIERDLDIVRKARALLAKATGDGL